MSKKSLLESVSLDELKRMYDNGMSCVEIANAVGVSDKTIYRHLQGHTNRHGGKYSRRSQLMKSIKPSTNAKIQQPFATQLTPVW